MPWAARSAEGERELSKKAHAFTARYRYDRDEGVWLTHVGEIPQVHTYGSTLAEAEAHLRDALALWLQVDPAELTLRPS